MILLPVENRELYKDYSDNHLFEKWRFFLGVVGVEEKLHL